MSNHPNYHIPNLGNGGISIFFIIVEPHTSSGVSRFFASPWWRRKTMSSSMDFRFLLTKQQGPVEGRFVVQSIWSSFCMFLSRNTLALLTVAADPGRLFVLLPGHGTMDSLGSDNFRLIIHICDVIAFFLDRRKGII